MIKHLKNNLDISHDIRCVLKQLQQHFALQSVREYVTLVYWELQACSRQDKGGNSSWWSLNSGDAVVFNNYRAHSDAGLGSVDHARYTIDLRCFDKIEKIPFEQKYSWDALATIFTHPLFHDVFHQQYRMECIPELFNTTTEYIESLIPGAFIQEIIGSISGNLIDRPEVSLVHNHSLNIAYYEYVKNALDNNDYNIDAFVFCVEKQLKELQYDEDKINIEL